MKKTYIRALLTSLTRHGGRSINTFAGVFARQKLLAAIATGTLLLSACFSPYTGDTGTITINVGGSSAGRVAWYNLETADFTHIITLTNGPGPDQSKTILPGVGRASFIVVPGMWTITVEGKLNGEIVSEGSKRVNIIPGGNNTITIQMSAPGDGFIFDPNDYDQVFYIPSIDDWSTALSSISSGKFAIVLDNDIYVSGPPQTIQSGQTVTIIPSGALSRTITLSYPGSDPLFDVQGTLTSRDLHIKSNTGNSAPLVIVTGTFTMNGGAISGNYGSGLGGGVRVESGGTFTMNNGSISDNDALEGGGVLVEGGGTFYMNGGAISGNNAPEGGGVHVTGAFYMNGGTIYGNTAITQGGGVLLSGTGAIFHMINGTIVGDSDYNGLTKNTAPSGTGAALRNDSGTATYGPNGTGNNILPAGTDMTDATIRVVNGVKQ